MTLLALALSALALTISAGTAVWSRRELRRQRQVADFRWRYRKQTN